ncbi:PAS domain-containing sensor histidine kinase [Sphingomonas sp. PAMC 26605]|uniref:PAS domain-containing sensor histidine kinase n=1 Tax=Sphingomonas sp. PAMC 26605 TaxID=1112214 RepID=UPI00026CAB9D|nr:PAS domain S-box protein [Sphingomonas sp. PAMC 26605]
MGAHAARPARTSVFIRYGYAILLVALFVAVRATLSPLLGHAVGFTFFTPAVLAAAALAGTGPALACAILSGGTVYVLYLSGRPEAAPLLIIFEGVSLGIILMTRQMERWRDRAQQVGDFARLEAQELALLIDGLEDHAIYLTDPQGKVLRWNRGAERLKGWSEDLILGRSWDLFYTDEQVALGQPQRDLEHARTHGGFAAVLPRRRADGSTFLADVRVSALRAPSGDILGYAKIVRDVTHEMEAIARIESSEAQLRSILDTVPEAMVVADGTGAIVSFGTAAEAMFGYSAAEIIGQDVSLLLPFPKRQWHSNVIADYVARGYDAKIGQRRRVIGQRADGTEFPVELAIGSTSGSGRRLITAFMRDITEQEEREARVCDLQAQLVHASRISAMGTLASTLGHELAQPMTAVATYLEGCRSLLRRSRACDLKVLGEALNVASNEAIRAGTILTRLREFVQRGELLLEVYPIRTLIHEATTLMRAQLTEHGIKLHNRLPAQTVNVIADRIQVQQVFVNLLRNAIEAMEGCDDREIWITCRVGSASAVEIDVVDSGPGLREDVQDDLFRAFRTTKTMGMGLGLSICQTMIEAQGGRIEVLRAETGGACFRFTLQREEPDHESEQLQFAEPKPASRHPRRR